MNIKVRMEPVLVKEEAWWKSFWFMELSPNTTGIPNALDVLLFGPVKIAGSIISRPKFG